MNWNYRQVVLGIGLMAVTLFGMFHVIQAAEVQVSAGAGGSYPYDGARVSGSPSLKAKALVSPWHFLAFGIGVSQQLNYIAEVEKVPSAGAPSGSQPYAGGSYKPHKPGNTTIINDNDTTTNNDSHDVTHIYLPQAQPLVAAPRTDDSRLASTLSLEPELQLGWPVSPCNKIGLWPYVRGSYGADRHTMQDGRTIYGNSYAYGAGVKVLFGRRYFLNAEASNKASESSVAVFRTVEAGIQAGMRFGL